MCVFGGGVAYGKGGVSLSGNGWVGPERRKESEKKKRTIKNQDEFYPVFFIAGLDYM